MEKFPHNGILCAGSAKSPEMFAPAIIPVAAGKYTENTVKKLFCTPVLLSAVNAGAKLRAMRPAERRNESLESLCERLHTFQSSCTAYFLTDCWRDHKA